MSGIDIAALWVGRVVMGLATGIFVLGAALYLVDYFGRILWEKLLALHGLNRLRKIGSDLVERDGLRSGRDDVL